MTCYLIRINNRCHLTVLQLLCRLIFFSSPPASRMIRSFILFAVFSLIAVQLSSQDDAAKSDSYAFAEVQSCKGCQLRGLPEVKSFIFDDVPSYGDNVVFKAKQGAPPELILYDEENKEVKRIPLRDYTRQGCNELMEQHGFKKRDKTEL